MNHIAVAALETPTTFILEGAELPPGKAYQGLRFLGGKVDLGEKPPEAIARELSEELDYQVATNPEHVWSGHFDSEDRTGRLAPRFFSLFRVPVGSVDELTLQPGIRGRSVEILGGIVPIDREVPLTNFARFGLGKVLENRHVMRSNAA